MSLETSNLIPTLLSWTQEARLVSLLWDIKILEDFVSGDSNKSKRRNSKVLIVSKPSSLPYREHCADKPCNRIFNQLFSTTFSNINSQESPEHLKTASHTKDRHPNKQADSKDNKNLEAIEESHYAERLHLSWCIYYSVGPDSPCKINEQ